MIQVEYQVKEADRAAFTASMDALAAIRRRDGAYAWGLMDDTERPGFIIEWFLVESWAEHLRQHHRVSHADADLQAEATRWHTGEQPPVVRHLLAVKR